MTAPLITMFCPQAVWEGVVFCWCFAVVYCLQTIDRSVINLVLGVIKPIRYNRGFCPKPILDRIDFFGNISAYYHNRMGVLVKTRIQIFSEFLGDH